MLKHVEQSVARYALKWFLKYEEGLAAYYAPQAELDPQFKGRLAILREKAAAIEGELAFTDPDHWDAETTLCAFQAALMLKDAMDAAGPLLLRRVHRVIATEGGKRGLMFLDPRQLEEERRRRGAEAPQTKKNRAKARRKRER